MTDPSDSEQALREVLAAELRPALAVWKMEEQTDALVGVMAAFVKKGFGLSVLFEVLDSANCQLELNPLDCDDWMEQNK